jgi:hypothetical protein
MFIVSPPVPEGLKFPIPLAVEPQRVLTDSIMVLYIVASLDRKNKTIKNSPLATLLQHKSTKCLKNKIMLMLYFFCAYILREGNSQSRQKEMKISGKLVIKLKTLKG